MKSTKGMTLIELMVVLVIFSIVMMGLYSSSSVLLRQGVKEYRIAESEMELGISSNVLARDMSMAGFGLAEDYSAATGFTIPRSVSASNGASGVPDTLTLMGTAIGLESRAAQGWSYMSAYDIGAGLPTFTSWNDAREDVRADPGKNDVVIMMDPSTKRLRVQGTDWLFRFNGLNANLTTLSGAILNLNTGNVGHLLYGLYTSGSTQATQPYYAVKYSLGGTPPSNCAPSTFNLLRAESRTSPAPAGGSPIINCVADFQVAVGLTLAGSPGNAPRLPLDFWDNGGVLAAGYTDPNELNKRLKQIRAYILVQEGSRDPNYTYSNPDPAYASTPNKIRVGALDLVGGPVGDDYTLSNEQRHYRWRVVSFIITPRNIR